MRPPRAADDDPVRTAADTAVFYDEFWGRYGVDPEEDERIRVAEVEAAFRDLIGGDDRRILDLGCGRGWMAPSLARWGPVTGIDFSPRGLDFARRHYGASGRFVLADPGQAGLGLPPGCDFDVVVCSEVIEHVRDAAALLRQIAGLLAPGGWCILTTPNARFWPQVGLKPNRNPLQPIENWLMPRALDRLVRGAGLAVHRHRGFADAEFRPRVSRVARSPWTRRVLRRLRPGDFGDILSLHRELYQSIVARKTEGPPPLLPHR